MGWYQLIDYQFLLTQKPFINLHQLAKSHIQTSQHKAYTMYMCI